MLNIADKLRWFEHPENSSLQQLGFNNCGMWFILEGTTVNAAAEMSKYCIMDKHAKALLGISLKDIEHNQQELRRLLYV